MTHSQIAITAITCWFAFTAVAVPLVYIGYGFAMAAKKARDMGFSQRKVVIVDGLIVLPFFILDVLINMLVLPVLCLDLHPRRTFTTVTSRLCQYNADQKTWRLRKFWADFFAAFLDGKDLDGDHVKGANLKFKWLG
jgi:hypothetical protein